MRILVIEDEKKTAAFLAKGLREAGFVVDLARDGETGSERARTTRFDLLIVDVMLPNKDGWEVVAHLRRAPARHKEHLRVDDLEIDMQRHKAVRSGVPLNLTPKEFLLVAHLARSAGEVVSRTEIAEHVWEIGFKTDTNVVDVVVRRLRAKVDDPFKTKLVHTIRGVGYVLKAH